MRTLNNRVAVVTGAGSGIGRALASELASRGCRLAIQDLSRERVEETAEQVRALGAEVLFESFDVSSFSAMEGFASRVHDELGGAHICINNAGVSLSGDFLSLSIEDWEWIVGINLWGVVYGTKLFLPQMLAQEEGHLVNISSIFGVIGVPTQSAYCATKFAVRGLTDTLQMELHGTKVGVTTVHPGAIDTNIAVDSRHNLGDREIRRAKKMLARGMAPRRAAEHIVDAIVHDKPRLRVGRDAIYLDRLARLFPVTHRWAVRKYSER